MSSAARFHFSLRSPYAWIAARWSLPRLPDTLSIEWHPFIPLPGFTNFPPPVVSKTRYLIRDVVRIVASHGERAIFPKVDAEDWTVSHCAFLAAQAEGRGVDFAMAVWEARFLRGEDVADVQVLARAAKACGLDGAAIVTAGLDAEARAALTRQVQSDYDDLGVFGVPTLILPDGTRYWGHDRIDWAIDRGHLAASLDATG